MILLAKQLHQSFAHSKSEDQTTAEEEDAGLPMPANLS
jgi:hypothetical protein